MCSDYHAGRWIDHANDDLSDWGFEPTHWMPLPDLPGAQQCRNCNGMGDRFDPSGEKIPCDLCESNLEEIRVLVAEAAHDIISGGDFWLSTSLAAKKIYALPGAQNVPEKLCYDSRWEISIDYVDGWNAAVDMMRGKSPSWHCPDCCIAVPFGAPTSCPNDDARCNRLLAAAQEAKL
mgnify:CR=1 FL=1